MNVPKARVRAGISAWAAAALTAALLPALLLAGCGGGGARTAETGTASFVVNWPPPGRLIPAAANSVRVRLTRDGQPLGERVIVRPAGGGEGSAVFTGLPIGPAVATATAHPDPEATGIPQAQAQVAFTIVGGQNAPLRLSLISTIVLLEIAPREATVPVGQTVPLSATARNAAGEIVLISPSKLLWNSTDRGVADVDHNGLVTARAPGTARITVTELESGIGAEATVTVTGGGTQAGVRVLDLVTNDLVYDPVSQRIYASVPASAGAGRGNSVTAIDPAAGTIGASVFVGSDPGKLAVSGNGQYLYVGLNGAFSVRRVDLTTQTAGLQFSLRTRSFSGPNQAQDIEVLPGNPEAVAISEMTPNISPRHAGVAIYDNGVPRAVTTPEHTGANVIEFGASAERLYGYTNESTEFGFRRMQVDAGGVSVLDVTESLISGFGVDIEYDAGRIYATDGRIIDPEARVVLGTIGPGLVRPDTEAGRAYVLSGSFGSTTWTLRTFDVNTFLEIDSLQIPNVSGQPASLIQWGPKSLAFRTGDPFGTGGGQVYLITLP